MIKQESVAVRMQRIRTACTTIVSIQGRDPYGHGYLWVQPVVGGKFCACSIDGRTGHEAILAAVRRVQGVDAAWINLD